MLTTRFATRKTVRTTIVSLIGAAALTLADCGGDEQPTPVEATPALATTAAETTTSSEAPADEAGDDGDDELANQVVASLNAGGVVSHRDDAQFWGTGVVREEISESKKKVAETILVDFESVPSSEFTFEPEGDCLVARAKDSDFKDRLTYFAAPGVANGTFEIGDERAEETGREFENRSSPSKWCSDARISS